MFLSVDPQTLPNFFVGSGGGSVARMIRGSLSRGQRERHHRERWQPQLHCSLGKSFLLESWGFKPRQGRVSGRDPAGAGPAELGSPLSARIQSRGHGQLLLKFGSHVRIHLPMSLE